MVLEMVSIIDYELVQNLSKSLKMYGIIWNNTENKKTGKCWFKAWFKKV